MPEMTPLHVDCANGVGAHCAQTLLQAVETCQDASSPKWSLILHNKGASSEDRLNEGCGADFVKVVERRSNAFKSVPADKAKLPER